MLKLQKVELLGFKSFADRTEIAFNGNGVAAVVGPNGCGKSNISDAIHWVLGEQSPKTLRSGRMQDVLFNGTPSRKATGLAEVRLTLLDPEAATVVEQGPLAVGDNGSNGNGAASAAKNGNGAIMVARRLFASGESEYLLNDRPCRLRDIQEIFLGTGLGPDSYAIIEQGRIGQILSAKPYERRALIEEAAGVTKFKAKRKLAWAKLESSKQNLARVNDILEEVTRQLHSLQRQAARARRYKELREQMQTQLRTILASRYRQKEEEATQTALELTLVRGTLQEQIALSEERELEQQGLRQLLERREVELREASEERGNLRLEAERARGQIATQSQQAAYLVRRTEEARGEQAQLDARKAALDAERSECAGLAEQLRVEKETLATELLGWEGRAKTCQRELEEKEHRREQLSQERLET
ncbi:MAG TPA: chromosome segregation protein SMC, partial [Terriglobia bacterium]